MLTELRNLIGNHEAIHRGAIARKPILPHRAIGSSSDLLKPQSQEYVKGAITTGGTACRSWNPQMRGHLLRCGVKEEILILPKMLPKSTGEEIQP